MVKKPASYDVNQAGIAERYYTMNGQAIMLLVPVEKACSPLNFELPLLA